MKDTVADKVEYTCPMHPQIVRYAPGNCPICGMTLEPRTIGAADLPDPELVSMTRRFWVGVVLTAPLLVLSMGHRVLGALDFHGWLGDALFNWSQVVKIGRASCRERV